MFDSPLSASAYEVLGVDPGVDDETLRRAYRLKLRQTHPDTGGDAVLFVQVQRAWELLGTPDARANYDRAHGFGADAASYAPTTFTPRPGPADTRPRARSHGHPGGFHREQYLAHMREWVGRGATLDDPYDPALVRSAPVSIRRLLADALAEEDSARTISDLGMGYTVWHDVAADRHDPGAKIDHIVLGPSGLYAVMSEDFGGPVGLRRSELTGEGVVGSPVATLVARARGLARAAGVRFGGVLIVLPDDDVVQPINEIGKVRGTRVAIVSRSALSNVLRRGITGAPAIGGNEIFDVRTRLQQTARFV